VTVRTSHKQIFLKISCSRSFSALQLITVLHGVVQSGASVLLTIHQPASDILEKIDRLVLLRAGRCMYNGLEDEVTDYFADRGDPLPPKYNPADFIMIVAQTVSEKDLEEAHFFPNSTDEEEALTKTKADFSRQSTDARFSSRLDINANYFASSTRSFEYSTQQNDPGGSLDVDIFYEHPHFYYIFRCWSERSAGSRGTFVRTFVCRCQCADFAHLITHQQTVQSQFGALIMT